MIAPLLVALLAAPAPRVTVEIPTLETSASRLAALAEWASLAEPKLAPSQIAADMTAAVGVDPLSPASLREAGIDATKPIRATLDPNARQIVVEAQLGDPAKADQHLARIQRRAASLSDAKGFAEGDAPIAMRAVVIDGARVWLLLGLDRRPPLIDTSTRTASQRGKPVALAKDRRLAPLKRAMADKSRVRPPKSLLDAGPADLWAVIEPRNEVERIDVVLRAPGRDVSIDFEAALAMTAEVAAGEALRGRSSARRRVDAGPIAAELSTTLTHAGLRAVLERTRVPPSAASMLAGPIQIGMAADGTLYAAAELDPKAPKLDTLPALARQALGADVQVEQRGDLLVAWVGKAAPREAPATANGSMRGAVALDITPTALLGAVEKNKARFGVRSMDLMMAQMLLLKLFGSIDAVRADVSLPSNRLRGNVLVKRR